MARVLAYTSPARGHLYPLVPILDELRSRGHDIALRTLASQVEAMRARGFDAEPLAARIEQLEHDDYLARTPQGGLTRALRTFARRGEVEAPDLRAAIGAAEPDALLVDVNTWGAQAVAQSSGRPWATWCPFPLPLPSQDAPPFGPGLAPARGPAGRLRDAVLRPLILRSYARAMLPTVNEVRARLGSPRLQTVTEPFETVPLLLYLTAAPFEYPRRDWPPNVVLVGSCDWEPPAEPPAWLEEIDRPIVLVTTSSELQDDARLVQAALDGLAGEPLAVIATVPAGDPAAFTTPANARVERFLPHGPILERAACAVTHGGMGATQKALAHGVPVCAVPFGRDQLEVARRVEVAGAGTRLRANRLTPQRLRAKVREAIGCAEGARRVAAGFTAAGGARAAADAIERRLLGGPLQADPAGSRPSGEPV